MHTRQLWCLSSCLFVCSFVRPPPFFPLLLLDANVCFLVQPSSLTNHSLFAEIYKQGGRSFPVYLLPRSCLPAHHHRVPTQCLQGETERHVTLSKKKHVDLNEGCTAVTVSDIHLVLAWNFRLESNQLPDIIVQCIFWMQEMLSIKTELVSRVILHGGFRISAPYLICLRWILGALKYQLKNTYWCPFANRDLQDVLCKGGADRYAKNSRPTCATIFRLAKVPEKWCS